METLIFGKYEIPTNNSSVVSYNVSTHLTSKMMELISFENNEIRINSIATEVDDNDDNEVTHEVFFGENIKRVAKTLFKK